VSGPTWRGEKGW